MNTEGCLGAVLHRAVTNPVDVALRFHHLGVWEQTTWHQYAESIDAAARGLRNLGVVPGSRVGLVAENSPAWLVAFFAVQRCGAVVVVLSPESSGNTVWSVFASQSVVAVIVGDQEQFDKIEEARIVGKLPSVGHIVVIATRGMRRLDVPSIDANPAVLSWSRMTASVPDTAGVSFPDVTDDSVAIGLVDEHGAIRERTHTELRADAHNAVSSASTTSSDECMALGSFANATSLTDDVLAHAISGMTISMSPVPELLLREIPEVRPTLLAAPSSILARIHADAQRRASRTKGLKRIAYRAALRRGAKLDPRPPTAISPLVITTSVIVFLAFLLASLTDSERPLSRLGPSFLLLFGFGAVAVLGGFAARRAVRNQYGLGRVRSVVSYGEPLDPGVLQWFQSIGVHVQDRKSDVKSEGVGV